MNDSTEYIKRLISILDRLHENRMHDDSTFIVTFVARTVGDAAIMMQSAAWPRYHAGNVLMEGIGIDTVNELNLRGDTRAMVFVDQELFDDRDTGFYSLKYIDIRNTLERSLLTTKHYTTCFMRELLVLFVGQYPERNHPIKPIRKFFHRPEGRSNIA